MRQTDFWQRMTEVFGPAYARSVAKDQVLPQLGGRTIMAALAEGADVQAVWRGCARNTPIGSLHAFVEPRVSV